MVLLLAQGGLLALGLILLDELDNAYGDVYSGAVSANSLKPSWSLRVWGMALAALCTVLALILPMHSLEPFLLMLSSVFVPLYGVILGRWRGVVSPSNLANTKSIDWLAAGLWLLGVVVFHACANWAPQFGSALPSLLVTFALARFLGGRTH
jgi:purine-cytosine permease-like protein